MSKHTASDAGTVDASAKKMSLSIDFSAISQLHGAQPAEGKKTCAGTKKRTKNETPAGASGVDPEELRDAQELVVDGTPPTDFSFSFLSGCRSLVKLKLKCNHSALDLQTLTGHEQLEMLEICNARFTDLAPLKNLPALKCMRAMHCSLLHDGSAYASRMEALEELELSSFCVRNRGDFDDLLNLREGLRCAGPIDAAHVLCAYKGSPRLRKVLLSCVEVRDLSSLLGFEALEEVELNGIKVLEGFGALGRHTTLRKLEVRQIPLTQDSLRGLGGSRSLVHLALEIPFSSGVQYDVSPLGNVVTLQVLRIWRSKQYQIPLWKEKPAQQVLAGLHVIGQLPHLMELSLSDYEILGDTVFELGASKTIARLSLHSMCSEHYASSLSCAQKKKESEKFTALSNLESLEELTIRDCQYFQVDAEFGYLPNLRVLKLHSYVNMDRALLRLSESLTLTVLEVIAADGFGDLMPIASIRTLEEVKLFLFGLAKNSDALGYLPRLRKLEIFCADVLDNSLDERRCTRLYMKYFMLGYVTHYDTAPLARAKALEKVVLCNFEGFSNLDALLELPSLREVKLSKLNKKEKIVAALTAKGVNVIATEAHCHL